MKRILSIMLALCMIISLLPMAFAADETATSEVTYTYDFLSLWNGTQTTIKETTAYSSSNTNWAFHSSNIGTVRTHKLGIEANASTEGHYFALKINIPTAGIYSANLVHGQSTSLAGYGSVYFLSGGSDVENVDVASAIANANPIGENLAYYTSGTAASQPVSLSDITVKVGEEGDHILVFKATGKGASNYRMYVTGLTLTLKSSGTGDGGDGGDGDNAGDEEPETLTYNLNPESKLASDKKDITSYTTYSSVNNWIWADTSSDFDVLSYNYNRIWVGDDTADQVYQNISGYYTYGIQIKSAAVGDWAAVKISTPTAGKYDVSLKYGRHNSGGGYGNVYILPVSSTSKIQTELDKNPAAINAEEISYDSSSAGASKEGKAYADRIAELGTFTVAEGETEHYLVFKATKAGGGNKFQMFPQSVTLTPVADSGTGDGKDDDKVLPVSLSGDVAGRVTVNGYSELVITAKMSDGSTEQMAPSELSFKSLNDAVAEVSEEGYVYGISEGSAEIEFKTKDGTAEGSVTVTVEPQGEAQTLFVYDFNEGLTVGDNVNTVKEYGEARGFWKYEGTSGPAGYIHKWGLDLRTTAKDSWVALRIKVTDGGRYFATLTHGQSATLGGYGNVYILPGNTSDIAKALESAVPLGENVAYFAAANTDVATTELSAIDLKPGEHILVFKANKQGASNYRQYPGLLELDASNIFRILELNLDKTEYKIYADGTADEAEATVTARLLDGTAIAEDELEVVYGSADADVATFADGVVAAQGPGETEIFVTVKHQGTSVTAKKKITVTDISGIKEAEIRADSFVFVGEEIALSTYVKFNSGNEIKISDVAYEITDGSATLDSGKLKSDAAGDVTVVGSFTFDGKEEKTEPLTLSFNEPTSKTESTYYTAERLEAARENVKKYDWARDAYDTAKAYAEPYLTDYKKLYELITSEGLPRSNRVGAEGDPDYACCRYCGVDINVKYGSRGNNAYDTDVVNRPWKVQCPDCKRLFPSNDFDKFYELGLNQQGEFDRLRALRAHRAMLIEKGLMTDNGEAEPTDSYDVGYHDEAWYKYYGYGVEGGYLYNKLYEELWKDSAKDTYNKDPRTGDAVDGLLWGVDDGLGYLPGRECAKDSSGNPIYERHAYIAYFVHDLWKSVNSHIVRLAEMYAYTGDIRYGRAGAVILDRVADLYPGFSYKQWDNMYLVAHGGSGFGKIFGRINDCTYATNWSQAADAFWDVYTDPEVIEFLSEKAGEYGYSNDKTSREKIWANIESGLLLEFFKAAKEGNIYGNYGQQQQALSSAALVLSREPESKEIMDWIYQPGAWSQNNSTKTAKCTGGNLSVQLVDVIDRDGIGDEAAPNYNTTWIENLIGCADILKMYSEDEKYNLYLNPKFGKMFTAHIPLVLTETHTAQIGDSGQTASVNFMDADDMIIKGFQNLMETPLGETLAEYIYRRNGYSTDGLHYDIWTKNPEDVCTDIEKKLSGEAEVTGKMLTGYGFAVLRDGGQYGDKSVPSYVNNMRDFWIYFGRNAGHGHADTLNLGIEAFGLNMAPDLGYPQVATTEPHRYQWMESTISHNTVTVNEKIQSDSGLGGKPLHFDETDEVKIMDVDAPQVYSDASIYRRTVVMINAGDDVSYGIDFFRVKGGNDHIYSFHSQSDEIAETSGLENMTYQTDNGKADGNYIGTYAGTTYVDPKTGETKPLEYGPDPCGSYDPDLYYVQRGFTWLKNIRRTADVGEFSVDFKVTDFRKVLKDGKGLHLKMTMLNDFPLSEVALASGSVPEKSENAPMPKTLEYVLARRTGENLDSLFTTVYEPYRNTPYIAETKAIAAENITSGKAASGDDVVKAVKVTRADGRIDYIVYSTDNGILYTITDGDVSFNFRGFVGVYSVTPDENGGYTCVYSYVHDGDVIGDKTYTGAYNVKISDFTRELEFESTITVKGESIDASRLSGKYIFVENDGVQNGVYEIAYAEETADGAILHLADSVSPIRSYKDENDTAKGFTYNISIGQNATIPLSNVEDGAPVIDPVGDSITATAGNSVSVDINAHSPVTENAPTIEYIGTTLPRGASVNAETGVVTWKPDKSQVGENHVAITARDSDGRESTVHFTITVYGSTTGSSSNSTDNSATDNSGTSTDSAGTSSGGGGGGGGTSGGGTTDTTPDGSASENTDTSDKTDSETTAEDNTTVVPSNGTFDDVTADAWYHDAATWMGSHGYMSGTAQGKFSPDIATTRGMLVTILYRISGSPEVTAAHGFEDVASGSYYEKAIAWAAENGIVTGHSDTVFAPDELITREQLAAIIYRNEKRLGNDVSHSADLSRFVDSEHVSAWALEAKAWAVGAGIINGTSETTLHPTKTATRAECATILYRIFGNR